MLKCDICDKDIPDRVPGREWLNKYYILKFTDTELRGREEKKIPQDIVLPLDICAHLYRQSYLLRVISAKS